MEEFCPRDVRDFSDEHPYHYKRRGRPRFKPLTRRWICLWLLLLVLPSAVILGHLAWMRRGMQLSLPPIESDWLRRDGERSAKPWVR